METPGCGFLTVAPRPEVSPLIIDNVSHTYFILVSAGNNASATFTAIRVYYTLQVSPAPAVATFADVPPSHPFFQFVEALARSGITSGCGGGGFCPDAPLTRGQMAVFLSRALGLHFAP
jgi:S-layer homology domain